MNIKMCNLIILFDPIEPVRTEKTTSTEVSSEMKKKKYWKKRLGVITRVGIIT